MPNAIGVPGNNPTINNPAVTLANGVLKRGDGFGSPTDPFIFDLGTQVAFTNASFTTAITGAPSTCTLVLQGSIDGNTWVNLATSTGTVADTQFSVSGTNNFTILRINVSNVTGGTSPTVAVAISAYASEQTAASGTQPVSGTVTANQGTPNTKANGWPIMLVNSNGNTATVAGNGDQFARITDGTNTASVNAAFGGGVGALRIQPIGSTGGLQETSGGGGIAVGPFVPTTANILAGSTQSTTTGQTLITIPAGRTWFGDIGIAVGTASAGAAVNASVQTAGTSVTPAANTILCAATATAGTATPTDVTASASGVYVVAPGGNSVTLVTALSAAPSVASIYATGILL